MRFYDISLTLTDLQRAGLLFTLQGAAQNALDTIDGPKKDVKNVAFALVPTATWICHDLSENSVPRNPLDYNIIMFSIKIAI